MLLRLVSALAAVTCALAWGETQDEVAQRARSLLTDPQTFGVGTFSTVYKDDHPVQALQGAVASGPEYFASCRNNGNLLMLAMPVSQNWRNALETSSKNATMSIMSSADPEIPDPRHTSKHDADVWDPKRPSWRRGMPSKQRLSLLGHIVRIPANDSSVPELRDCYLRAHPDARHWMPGSDESPHVAFWVEFVVDAVYRVGGFGDESAIGWIDIDRYRRAGRATESTYEDRPARLEQEEPTTSGAQRVPKTDNLFAENAAIDSAPVSLHFQQS